MSVSLYPPNDIELCSCHGASPPGIFITFHAVTFIIITRRVVICIGISAVVVTVIVLIVSVVVAVGPSPPLCVHPPRGTSHTLRPTNYRPTQQMPSAAPLLSLPPPPPPAMPCQELNF